MLEKIRKIAHHYLFKLFFFLIAIAFALSLGDLSKSQPNTVATIGRENISLAEFLQAKQEISQQYGTENTPPTEQLDNIVLKKLVVQTLLRVEAEDLGIKVSPETLAEYIRNDPSFHKEGEFNLEIYKKLLTQNNLSEKMLLKSLSDQVAGKFLIEGISVNLPLKKILNDYVYQYITEKRNIALITIDASKQEFTNIPEADLKSYFQMHQELFQTKEQRSYSYLKISPEEIKKNLKVTDSDLKKEYEENLAEYTMPETRDFYHFVAPTEELAIETASLLRSNPNEASVAKTLVAKKVISEKFTNHPSSSFIASINPDIFALKENAVTSVTKSDLGWHVFKVMKINAKENESFADAKAKVETKLRQKLLHQQIYDLSKQIEDDIASGSSLQDIAKRHNLYFEQVKQTSGNDPITLAAFQTKLGEESEIIELKDPGAESAKGYFVVKVDEIIPVKPQQFNEVTDKVKELYSLKLRSEIAKEAAKVLQASANSFIQDNQLNNDQVTATLSPIYNKYKINADKNILITLAKQNIGRPVLEHDNILPVDFVNSLFNLKIGQASTAQTIDTAKEIFAVLNKIMFDSNKDQQVYQYIELISENNYKNDLQDQYINYLQHKHNVKINYSLIHSAAAP